MAVELSELGGHADARIPAYYCLAQKLLAKGNVAEADEQMRRGDEASRHPTASVGRPIHAANRVMFSIQRGDLSSAENWGRQLAQYPSGALWIWTGYAPPRLLMARGENESAAQQLRGLHERAVKATAVSYAIRIRVYQALAAPTQDEALTFLTEALREGEPEGFIRTFVDEGKLLRPLLLHSLSKGITPEYTTKLLAIIEAEERQIRTAEGKGGSVLASTEFMSRRESEVLQLVADGLSNQEIAQKLTISLNTAKTHVSHVFAKLNARDRLQAVTRAKELKLI
jgi:LuxR family maltose regulon positive regulatory protein